MVPKYRMLCTPSLRNGILVLDSSVVALYYFCFITLDDS